MTPPPAQAPEASAVAPEMFSNFYLGFMFLPRRRREALSAVYAYCRVIDDIVDSGEHSEDEARGLLEFWRQEIARLYDGKPAHPLARRLLPFVGEFDLPREGFDELISGMEMDLGKVRYESFGDLERYLFGAAGTVGLLCVNIFGYKRTPPNDIREYAVAMGNAFQLTNILRDVGADLERGRIYIPRADIEEAGYSLESFARREHSVEFEVLMHREYERAKAFYRKARGFLHPADKAAMLPAEVMAHVYEALLEKMKEEKFRVFFQRVRIPVWRKLLLALRAWAASRGIY